jgi:hypothetical protein
MHHRSRKVLFIPAQHDKAIREEAMAAPRAPINPATILFYIRVEWSLPTPGHFAMKTLWQ